MKTAARVECAAVFGGGGLPGWSRAARASPPGRTAPAASGSAVLEGEGVEVVGEDAPADPRFGPGLAAQSGAAQSVAALGVADAALAADAVARQPPAVRREGGCWRPAMKIVS